MVSLFTKTSTWCPRRTLKLCVPTTSSTVASICSGLERPRTRNFMSTATCVQREMPVIRQKAWLWTRRNFIFSAIPTTRTALESVESELGTKHWETVTCSRNVAVKQSHSVAHAVHRSWSTYRTRGRQVL
eukprot:24626_3